MRKYILCIVVTLIFCCSNLSAQQKDVYTVQPCQAGTLAFTNNRSMQVVLENNVQQILSASKLNASYYVVFTAVDNETYTYVSDKNNRSFTAMIKPAPGLPSREFKIDYVVFVKKKLEVINLNKPTSAAIQPR